MGVPLYLRDLGGYIKQELEKSLIASGNKEILEAIEEGEPDVVVGEIFTTGECHL